MKPHLLQPPLHYKYSWEESHRGRENLYNQNTQYRQRINLIGDISQKRQQRQSNYDNESADVWLFQIAKVIPWSYDYQEVNYTSLNFQQRTDIVYLVKVIAVVPQIQPWPIFFKSQ